MNNNIFESVTKISQKRSHAPIRSCKKTRPDSIEAKEQGLIKLEEYCQNNPFIPRGGILNPEKYIDGDPGIDEKLDL
jgi:hypothetical protein